MSLLRCLSSIKVNQRWRVTAVIHDSLQRKLYRTQAVYFLHKKRTNKIILILDNAYQQFNNHLQNKDEIDNYHFILYITAYNMTSESALHWICIMKGK